MDRDARKNRIIIENGLVKLVEERITKAMDLSDLVKRLSALAPTRLPILPPSTVYYQDFISRGERKRIIVTEVHPGRRTLRFRHSGHTDAVHTNYITKPIESSTTADVEVYRLLFPWQYFWFIISGRSLSRGGSFTTKTPLASENESVYAPTITNLHAPGKGAGFCFGSVVIKLIGPDGQGERPFRDAIRDLMTDLFTSNCNADLRNYFPVEVQERYHKNVFLLEQWQTLNEHPCFRIKNTRDKTPTHSHKEIPLMLRAWEEISNESTDDFAALKWKYLKMGNFKELMDWVVENDPKEDALSGNSIYPLYGKTLIWE